jgi:hypothetical protein
MLILSFIQYVKNVFKPESYGSELEAYIVSHNPSSVEDVEYLTRRFDQNLSKGAWSL